MTDQTAKNVSRRSLAPCSSLVGEIEEVSICEHPNFHTKQEEWGVIEAHWSNVEWDEFREPTKTEWVPENRENYRPELDGKSMDDMWNHKKGCWAIEPPGFAGITHFLRPMLSWTNSELQGPQSVDNHKNKQ